MTLMRYWLYTMLLAIGGGFLMLESRSFAGSTITTVALGVAAAATVLSVAALDTLPSNRRIAKGLAAASAVVAGLTLIGQTGLFSAFTEKWIAFTGGAVLLGLALVSLCLHEITTERVVHELELGREPAREPAAAPVPANPAPPEAMPDKQKHAVRARILKGIRMPVPYWIYSMLLGLVGGFLVIETQAFTGSTVTNIALGVAIGATLISLAALYEVRSDRLIYRIFAGASLVVAALTVISQTGLFSTFTEKWLAFAGGAAILVLAICSLGAHEITTERVVHELEIAEREHEGKPAEVT